MIKKFYQCKILLTPLMSFFSTLCETPLLNMIWTPPSCVLDVYTSRPSNLFKAEAPVKMIEEFSIWKHFINLQCNRIIENKWNNGHFHARKKLIPCPIWRNCILNFRFWGSKVVNYTNKGSRYVIEPSWTIKAIQQMTQGQFKNNS